MKEEIINQTLRWFITNGLHLLFSILSLIVGLWLIKHLCNWFNHALQKGKLNLTLQKFLLSIFNMALKLLLVIAVMSMVGVHMTSFIAILGSIGVAIGMALSGTLQNFAGGVIIIILKPFKIGDFIEAQGYSGTVLEIVMFHTILKTSDNRIIIIPNGPLSTGSLINYSKAPTRRIDFTFSISYEASIDIAKETLLEIIDSDNRILKSPDALVAIKALSESSVDFTVKVWVKSGDYWNTFYDINEKVKKRFDEKKITMPYPQRSIHIINDKKL